MASPGYSNDQVAILYIAYLLFLCSFMIMWFMGFEILLLELWADLLILIIALICIFAITIVGAIGAWDNIKHEQNKCSPLYVVIIPLSIFLLAFGSGMAWFGAQRTRWDMLDAGDIGFYNVIGGIIIIIIVIAWNLLTGIFMCKKICGKKEKNHISVISD